MPFEEAYSISDLANLTGIKAHTIRMWEKRYSILTPCRDCNNKRTYSRTEKHKLIKISCLYNRGYKISFLANMSLDELEQEYAKELVLNQPTEVHLDTINLMIERLEESKLYRYFNKSFTKFGCHAFISDCVLPLLARINLLYLSGRYTKQQMKFFNQVVLSFLDHKLVELHMETDSNNSEETTIVVPLDLSFEERLHLHCIKFDLIKDGQQVSYLPIEDLALQFEKLAKQNKPSSPLIIFCCEKNISEIEKFISLGSRLLHQKKLKFSGPLHAEVEKQYSIV